MALSSQRMFSKESWCTTDATAQCSSHFSGHAKTILVRMNPSFWQGDRLEERETFTKRTICASDIIIPRFSRTWNNIGRIDIWCALEANFFPLYVHTHTCRKLKQNLHVKGINRSHYLGRPAANFSLLLFHPLDWESGEGSLSPTDQ